MQWMLAVWSLLPPPFLNLAWKSGSVFFFFFHIMLKPWCKILSMTFLGLRMILVVSTFSSTTLLGIGMKTDIFQSCGHCWVFQICWHNECNTLMMWSFGVINSCTGILSHPRALLIALLPKAFLISFSRMSGSGWLITPSNNLVNLDPFYTFLPHCFHLFFISSTSSWSLPFMSFIVLIFG